MLNVPKNLHSHPEEHDRRNIYMFNFLVVHYGKVKRIKTKGGHDVHHVLIRPNWSRSPDCLDPFVAKLLHYCTLESALNYTKLSDHCAHKRKADGSLSSRTFNCRLDELGEDVYSRLALWGDYDPVAYLKDTKVSDLVGPEDAKLLSDSYAWVLKALDAMSDHIYFRS